MRKVITLLLAVTLSHLYSGGQTTDLLNSYEEGELQVRQKPGSDRLLADWLDAAGVKEDTVYAFLFVPGSCPRCESSIRLYHKELRKTGRKLMLISVIGDRETADYYNRKKGYEPDYALCDSTDRYKGIFSFNNVDLGGLYLLKLARSGRMVTGIEGSSFDDNLFTQLTARREPLPYHDFVEKATGSVQTEYVYTVEQAKPHAMSMVRDYRLNVSVDAPLCETFSNPWFDGREFYYTDELVAGMPIYRLGSRGSLDLVEVMRPADSERNAFIKLDSADLRLMASNGGVHYIPCNAAPLDEGHIGLSYSLPHIFYETPTRMAYYNEACVLSRRKDGLTPDSLTDFDFDTKRDGYFYQHFQFSSTGGKLIVGCGKLTWPYDMEEEEYRGKAGMDPFDESFYSVQNPFMAAFDRKTGKLLFRFGNLDDIARKTRTGYYFFDPVSVVCGNELAYTDTYSGKVCVADTADLAKTKARYTVFAINDDDMTPPDTANFYSFAAAKAYRGLLCRGIMDMRLTPDRLFCMVKYGDMSTPNDPKQRFTLVEVDRKTGRRREWLYPEPEGRTVFTRGLYTENGKVRPYEVLKGGDGPVIRVLAAD